MLNNKLCLIQNFRIKCSNISLMLNEYNYKPNKILLVFHQKFNTMCTSKPFNFHTLTW